MKPSTSFFNRFDHYLLALFLFIVPFSIAAAFVFFTLLGFLWIWRLLKKENNKGLPLFFLILVVFTLFTLVSTVFSVKPMVSLRDNKELFHFLLIPIILTIVHSVPRMKITLLAAFSSAVLSSLLGIYEWSRKGITLSNRLKGATSHWMTFSGLLMLVFVFFLIYLLHAGKKREWLKLPPFLGLILVVVLMSLTRNVWLGIAGTVFLYVVFFRTRWLFVMIPLLLVFLLIMPGTVRERVFSIVDIHDPSNRDRLHMAYAGWNIFLDHPWTGVGANNIETLYHRYRHPQAEKDNPHLHNNFLQLLAERGVFAFALFLLFCFVYIRDTAEIAKRGKSKRKRAVALASMSVFIAFLIAGMFEYNFGDTEIRFLLFYFMCLPYLPIDEEEYDQDEAGGRDLLAFS